MQPIASAPASPIQQPGPTTGLSRGEGSALRFSGGKPAEDSVNLSALKDMEPMQQLFALDKFLGRLEATVSQDAVSGLEGGTPVMHPISDNKAQIEIDGQPFHLVRERVTKNRIVSGSGGSVDVPTPYERWRLSSVATVRKGPLLKKHPKVELRFDRRLKTERRFQDNSPLYSHPSLSYSLNGEQIATTELPHRKRPQSYEQHADLVHKKAALLFDNFLADLMKPDRLQEAAPDLPTS